MAAGCSIVQTALTLQTLDSSMNFMNPTYNGQRGLTGVGYREYIPQADLDRLADTGARIRDAIAAVRGRTYTLEPGILLYPTSGTGSDYAYSRNFVDASKRRVFAFTIETAQEFQPPYSEALNVIDEVSSGLIQFCLSCLCPIRAIVHERHPWDELEGLLDLLRRLLEGTSAGRAYLGLVQTNAAEVTEILARDDELRGRAADALMKVAAVSRTLDDESPQTFDRGLIHEVDEIIGTLERRGGDDFRRAAAQIREAARHFAGRTLRDGLAAATAARESDATD